jgi:hypothetical protein
VIADISSRSTGVVYVWDVGVAAVGGGGGGGGGGMFLVKKFRANEPSKRL